MENDAGQRCKMIQFFDMRSLLAETFCPTFSKLRRDHTGRLAPYDALTRALSLIGIESNANNFCLGVCLGLLNLLQSPERLLLIIGMISLVNLTGHQYLLLYTLYWF